MRIGIKQVDADVRLRWFTTTTVFSAELRIR